MKNTINLELINIDPVLLKQQLDIVVASVADNENAQLVYGLTDCLYDSLYKHLDQ